MKRFILIILMAVAAVPVMLAAPPKFPADILFVEKYLKSPNTEVTLIEGDSNNYRRIEVSNDKAIVDMIKKVVEQDLKLAYNKVVKYSGSAMKVILNIRSEDNKGVTGNVSYTIYDDSNASYWIQYCP